MVLFLFELYIHWLVYNELELVVKYDFHLFAFFFSKMLGKYFILLANNHTLAQNIRWPLVDIIIIAFDSFFFCVQWFFFATVEKSVWSFTSGHFLSSKIRIISKIIHASLLCTHKILNRSFRYVCAWLTMNRFKTITCWIEIAQLHYNPYWFQWKCRIFIVLSST